MSDAQFAKAEKEFFDRTFAMNPLLASYLGLSEPYNRLMPDGGPQAVRESVVVLKEYLDSANALDDRGLSPSRAIDKAVIRYAYDLARFAMDDQRSGRMNPDALGDFLAVCFLTIARDDAPPAERLAPLAARLWELPVYLEQFRGRIGGERIAVPLFEAAVETARAAPGFLMELCAYAGSTEARAAEIFERSCRKATSAVETHLQWLHSLASRASGDGAIGRDRFNELISIRRLGLDVPDILDLAQGALDRGKSRLAQTSRELASGLGPADPRMRLHDGGAAGFEGVLATVRRRVAEARQFVVDEDLVHIPDGDAVEVVETPTFLRAFIPFAAVFPPGKFDRVRRGVCMVTRPPDDATLAARFSDGEITNLVAHETYPGHFLQSFVTGFGSKTRWLVQAPETVEGWAHYAEQLMLDRGFHDTAAARHAQARATVWRAARVVMDVRLACGEWSDEEAAAYMAREASLDAEGARSEVRRARLQPGRLLSYLVGKWLIARLRVECRESLGDRFFERAFHDAICANGYLPHALLRPATLDALGIPGA
ncbi:MAG: DUF885 domain-containing protein [Deltaproteobacteria bacterium]|nr:DUF885 domain-containing protein [Deltaproteobacteria bacterium]